MRKLFLLAGIAAAVVLSACAHSHLRREACVGIITKIEELPGEHYSPAKGHQPLYGVSVRLHRVGHKSSTDQIRILVLELYNPSRFGSEGDTLHFTCPKQSLQTGEIWFEELTGYRITS